MKKDTPPMIQTPDSIRESLAIIEQCMGSVVLKIVENDVSARIVSRRVSEGLFGIAPTENKNLEALRDE
ncbi:MAG: hypothetical protein V4678_01420 [Patescibacteria group bacterium]